MSISGYITSDNQKMMESSLVQTIGSHAGGKHEIPEGVSLGVNNKSNIKVGMMLERSLLTHQKGGLKSKEEEKKALLEREKRKAANRKKRK